MKRLESNREGKPLTVEEWDGVAFDRRGEQRDKFCLALIYNMGFKHLIEILSQSSREARIAC